MSVLISPVPTLAASDYTVLCLILLSVVFIMAPTLKPEQIQENIIKVMKEEFSKLKTEFTAGMRADYADLKTEMKAEFQQLINQKNQQISQLQDNVNLLNSKVLKLENSLDDADAVTRVNQIVISGEEVPTAGRDEDTKKIVLNLFRNKLKLQCNESEIVTATRLGSKPVSQRPDRRSILVTTFCNSTKANIFAACKAERPPFYVNENLTPRRRTIMYVLRKIKKAHPDLLKGYSSYDGRVFAYTPPPPSAAAVTPRDVRTPVNTYDGLVKFCNDLIQVPLSSFLATWPH